MFRVVDFLANEPMSTLQPPKKYRVTYKGNFYVGVLQPYTCYIVIAKLHFL